MEIKDPKDALNGMRAREAVHAIARGFSPEKALKLFDNDDLMFETIDLSNIARTEKDLERVRGNRVLWLSDKGKIIRKQSCFTFFISSWEVLFAFLRFLPRFFFRVFPIALLKDPAFALYVHQHASG